MAPKIEKLKKGDKKARAESSSNTSITDKDSKEETSLCGACNKAFQEEEGVEALKCDMCNYWHHTICEDVSTETFQFLRTTDSSKVASFGTAQNVNLAQVR